MCECVWGVHTPVKAAGRTLRASVPGPPRIQQALNKCQLTGTRRGAADALGCQHISCPCSSGSQLGQGPWPCHSQVTFLCIYKQTGDIPY